MIPTTKKELEMEVENIEGVLPKWYANPEEKKNHALMKINKIVRGFPMVYANSKKK